MTPNKAVNRNGGRCVLRIPRHLAAARFPWSFGLEQLQFDEVTCLSTTQQLEETVRQLSAAELAAFRAWFAAFDAEEWDRQMESDVAARRSIARRQVAGRCLISLVGCLTAHAVVLSRSSDRI